MPHSKPAGFTLLELMVTIAVAAILLAIGLPSFQSTLRSNRVATATNELMASLALARTEAIRGTRGGGVCPSADGSSCGTDWDAGWLVWSDAGTGGTGTYESGTDTVIRYSQARSKVEVATPSSGFAFDSRGRLTGGIAGTVTVAPEACPSGAPKRTLTISPAGQVRVARSNCT